MKTFWALFILDAWITSGFFMHALMGLAVGGADAEAFLLYLLLIGGTVAVVAGSLWLSSRGRMKAAKALLLSIALLPVMTGLAFVVLLGSVTNSR